MACCKATVLVARLHFSVTSKRYFIHCVNKVDWSHSQAARPGNVTRVLGLQRTEFLHNFCSIVQLLNELQLLYIAMADKETGNCPSDIS